jgi:DNA polymerase elongation subunit (family B)
MIKRLAKVPKAPDGRSLTSAIPHLITFLRQQVDDLKNGRIPLVNLLVSQRLSREITEYRVPSPACRAVMQLEAIGKPRRPGQRIRFWFVRGDAVVHTWDLPAKVDTAVLDTERYTTLLLRAASAILQPLGMSEAELRQAVLADAWQLPLSIHQSDMLAFGIRWLSAGKKQTRQGSGR